MAHMATVADHIIEKCGGAKPIAQWLGIMEGQVRRWRYPQIRGGADGRVPSKHQAALIEAARANGIALTPDDFFPEHLRSGAGEGRDAA